MSKLPYLSFQGWATKAERIQCPTPLPKNPAIPLLMKMLVPAPYQAPEKKAKKKAKETRSGLRRKGTSDVTSEDTETHSSPDEDEGEEEESESPLKGERKKRGASTDLEAVASKKGRISLTDDSESDADEWRPDTSPTYLLFQTLLPLFWTLTCMI